MQNHLYRLSSHGHTTHWYDLVETEMVEDKHGKLAWFSLPSSSSMSQSHSGWFAYERCTKLFGILRPRGSSETPLLLDQSRVAKIWMGEVAQETDDDLGSKNGVSFLNLVVLFRLGMRVIALHSSECARMFFFVSRNRRSLVFDTECASGFTTEW